MQNRRLAGDTINFKLAYCTDLVWAAAYITLGIASAFAGYTAGMHQAGKTVDPVPSMCTGHALPVHHNCSVFSLFFTIGPQLTNSHSQADVYGQVAYTAIWDVTDKFKERFKCTKTLPKKLAQDKLLVCAPTLEGFSCADIRILSQNWLTRS